MNEVIRINLRTSNILCEKLKEEYKYFGNRGLTANIIIDEVNPNCDPLGEENKLIFATGLFAGTKLTTSGRLSVGAKSPLTNGIKEANSGGTLAGMMAKHGIRAIIIEDLPTDEQWKIIKINRRGDAELIPADEFVGLGNFALVEKLKEKYGENFAAAVCGVAGERLYGTASIMVTDFVLNIPCRAAARGGLGAVMGSKRIKALLIEKPDVAQKPDYADEEKFNAALKGFHKLIIENDKITSRRKYGTFEGVRSNEEKGILPVHNFRSERFADIDKIDAKAIYERLTQYGGKVGVACQPGCLALCSNIYNNSKGELLTSGFNYETLALVGSNCGISSLDVVAEIAGVCDDFGIDTIETGAALGLCMEAGKIPWGDGEAAKKIVREMVEGTELGDLMGKGAAHLGKVWGIERVPAVKGQAFPGYDPRGMLGMGINYATSTMGADHTTGAAQVSDGNCKAMMVATQNMIATCDNFCCLFISYAFMAEAGMKLFLELMSGLLGGDWDVQKFQRIGQKTLMLEKLFNYNAGVTWSPLPEFIYREKSPITGTSFEVTDEQIENIYDIQNVLENK